MVTNHTNQESNEKNWYNHPNSNRWIEKKILHFDFALSGVQLLRSGLVETYLESVHELLGSYVIIEGNWESLVPFMPPSHPLSSGRFEMTPHLYTFINLLNDLNQYQGVIHGYEHKIFATEKH